VFLELAAGCVASVSSAFAANEPVEPAESSIEPGLLRRAVAALELHRDSISHRDVMGVVDFSLPSRVQRFYVINLADGHTSSHLVAHGRGSDPHHSGWVERFSNEMHSYATSKGAYRTASQYSGAHGESIRLEGLDASNDNAMARAIVVHAAPYVSEAMIRERGVLGRSQGCFAVDNSSLRLIMAKLGPGRLIYADKA